MANKPINQNESLNLKIFWSKGLAFSSFFGVAYLYDEVTVRGCPLWWELAHLLLLKMITLFDVRIMSRDIEISSKRKSNYYRRGTSEKKTTTYFPSSKQTQPKSLSQLAYLPPEKPRDIVFIQLVRERVKRCWVSWIRSIVVIFHWISSIEGKWSRLFIMLAASFLSILWMCIPWQPYFFYTCLVKSS